MKTIKTSDLTGVILDWAVAKCEGITVYLKWMHTSPPLPYSTDWAQGGPIIERERVTVSVNMQRGHEDAWHALHMKTIATGPTPLIAAMRCYVASKLGDTVEVPEWLAS